MTRPDTNSLEETPEAKKNRLLEQNLAMIESDAKEGREALQRVLAFISGIRFSTPNAELLKHLEGAVRAEDALRQIHYVAGCIRKDQAK